jgi:DNA-directed RNA polymerase beta subunit
VGQLIPQSDLPFTRDGVTPDILFTLGNPVGR